MSGFEYNGFIHRDLEPQVRYDAEQIQLLKQADQKIYDTISTLPLGGEKVSFVFPAGASEGTITADQLTKLQASESNYIEMVNDKELYTLNDNGHVEGYLTYSHVGIENSKATIKTLTITVSAKSFVIVTTVVPTESGGKLYRHDISFYSAPPNFLKVIVYSSKQTEYTPATFVTEFLKGLTTQGISGALKKDGLVYPLYQINLNYQDNSILEVSGLKSDGGFVSLSYPNYTSLSGGDTVMEL